jgi:hypothetical protein
VSDTEGNLLEPTTGLEIAAAGCARVTMTAPDAASAARLQKMAEAMRLMHEATAQ